MRKSITACAFGSVVIAIACGSVVAKVANVTLKELIATSETIVVGKIVEVRTIEGVRVARFRIERSAKGPTLDDLWFLAQSTWTCDITSGDLDDRAILFLREYQFDPEPKVQAPETTTSL